MHQFKSARFLAGCFAGAVIALSFLAACGGGGGGGATAIAHGVLTALGIEFDNGTSGLAADNLQDAVDELDGRIDSLDMDTADHETRIGNVEGTAVDHGGRILALESASASHGTELTDHETRISDLESATVAAVDVTYDNTASGLTATDTKAAIDELAAASCSCGSTFIRWGNTAAPTGTTKLYDGLAMGTNDGSVFVMKGGDAGGSTTTNQYFQFMATDPDSGTLPTGITADRRIVGCVCFSEKPTAVLYGTHTAPTGWSVLYKGYVLSNGSAHIVVDSDNFDGSASAAGSESSNAFRLRRFSTTHDSTNYPSSTQIKGCVVQKD